MLDHSGVWNGGLVNKVTMVDQITDWLDALRSSGGHISKTSFTGFDPEPLTMEDRHC